MLTDLKNKVVIRVIQLSSSQRWHSSERIAQKLLEDMGLKVVETNKKVIINNVEVGEVDIVARDDEGNMYAVEVKAGKLDVTGVRQAYINAILLEMKPMVICKGFADDAAYELASHLGIKVIQLSDIFLVESEELEIVIREAVEDAVSSIFELILEPLPTIRDNEKKLIEVLASAHTLQDAASKLDIPLEVLLKNIDTLRSQGVIPKWARKWSSIKRCAQILATKIKIYDQIMALQQMLDKMQQVIPMISKLSNVLKQSLNTAENILHLLETLEVNLKRMSLQDLSSQPTSSTEVQQGNDHH